MSCLCNFCGSCYGCCLPMRISLSLCWALKKKDYILILVYCNTDVLESMTVWFHKGPNIFNFGLVFSLVQDWDDFSQDESQDPP